MKLKTFGLLLLFVLFAFAFVALVLFILVAMVPEVGGAMEELGRLLGLIK